MSAASEPGYFFIIGAMKAGTTSLFKYLAGHPDLYPSPRKEPRIFRDRKRIDRLRGELTALFANRSEERWCFEASTAYTKFPRFSGVPERVHSVVPDARFIYIVRNPVERIWSQYVHNLAHGRESRSFDTALAEESHYVHISRYHLQLTQYYRVFPSDRVLVLVFEEMIKDPEATVRTVCSFLGVDAAYVPIAGNEAYNVSAAKRTATPSVRLVRSLGVEEALPWRVRNWMQQGASPLPARREGLTPELRGLVVEALRDDTEAFFNVFGRRIAAWTDFASVTP